MDESTWTVENSNMPLSKTNDTGLKLKSQGKKNDWFHSLES